MSSLDPKYQRLPVVVCRRGSQVTGYEMEMPVSSQPGMKFRLMLPANGELADVYSTAPAMRAVLQELLKRKSIPGDLTQVVSDLLTPRKP